MGRWQAGGASGGVSGKASDSASSSRVRVPSSLGRWAGSGAARCEAVYR